MQREVAAKPSLRREQLVVFFDGACGICTGIRETLAKLDVLRRVKWIPLQTPRVLPLVGLTVEEAMDTVWALRPDGRLVHGVEALTSVLDALLPTAGMISRLVGKGALRAMLEPLFHVLSKNRQHFAACEVHLGKRYAPLHPADEAALSARMPRLPVEEIRIRGDHRYAH